MPGAAVSVPPSTTVPVGAGGCVELTGGAGSVAADGAEARVTESPGLVAVTTTTIGWPTSAAVGEYSSSVAPGMSVQVVPSASQRCHWYS